MGGFDALHFRHKSTCQSLHAWLKSGSQGALWVEPRNPNPGSTCLECITQPQSLPLRFLAYKQTPS